MESGEAVLVRTVKSHDLQGHKVTNDPILLMGKTEMPMRYMFLHEEFDQSVVAADIAVRAEHSGFDLNEVSIAPRKTLKKIEIWYKTQQALKLQQEQLKTERKTVSREQREAEKQRRFELKQQKRKEKHRGR